MTSALEKDGMGKPGHLLACGVMMFLFLAISVIGVFDELTRLLVTRIAGLAADIVGISTAPVFFTMRGRRLVRLGPGKCSSDAKRL